MTENDKEKIDKISSSFWGFFINRRPIAWLVLIGIIIAGIFSLNSLPQEIQPEVNIPFVSVVAVLPGAGPSDTESLLTIPLEKEISGISDIKTLGSTSGFGFSSIFIEFEASADIDSAIQKVKDAADIAKMSFPADATEPSVIKAEANNFAIITFSITSTSNREIHELSKIAENIKNHLEKIKDVSTVQIIGNQKKYVEITLDQKKVEGYGLDIQTISNLIKYANNNLPIGIISSDKMNYSVRIDNRYQSLEEMRNIPLFSLPDENSTTIFLKDIAHIEETYPTQSVLSKLSIDGNPSKPTVSIQLFNKDDTNIVATAEDAREIVDQLKEDEKIPNDIEIIVSNDNSAFIKEELGNLTKNGIQTALIITFILFLALGLRQGIIAGLSIPTIFLIAFIVMDSQGMTLNTLSLFSLVIALGLIVDTTIVIMEGIHENLKKGMDQKSAALLSVNTYKWPLIAGTMTTVFAFFPMLLVSGILGEFLKTLPITISAALFGSLIVSLTIAPAIATKFIKKYNDKKKGSILEPFFEKLGEKFHKIIKFIVTRKSIRTLTIICAIIAFGASMALPFTNTLKTEMFPVTDQNYFIIQIETGKGIIIEETLKIAEEVEQFLYEIPEVTNFITKIGTSQSLGISGDDDNFFSGGTTNSNLANITVNLTEKNERERKSYEISKELRDQLKTFTKAKVKVEEISEGPPSDAAITARITGKDPQTLTDIADQVKSLIQNTKGTTNTEISLTPGLNEFKFTLDKEKLSYHGLSSMQVAGLIRNTIQGIEADEITIDGEDLKIILKYNLPKENGRTNISIHELENIEIQTPKGYSVTLGEIGNYSLEQSLSSIERENEKRIIKVTSDIGKDANATEITKEIEKGVEKLDIPGDYEIRFGGDKEQIQESFNDLFKSMFVGIILIAFTLVLMFNSFKQPLIILITLPLALIGVFPGLYLVGVNLSFPAFLGVVALVGIVVNDAIVLIDRINTNRKNGTKFAESIAEATNARLQPILMTSITTIAGILPLALTNEFWAGLGFSLVFGLACATVLTLIVIPVLYYGLEYRKAKKLGEV